MPKPVKAVTEPKAIPRADLDNEVDTIRNYRERVVQSEAIGEFAIAEEIIRPGWR